MLRYLWKNRQRSALASRTWLKDWAKRVWTLPSLLQFFWRSASLRWRGAEIGEGTLFSPVHAAGNLKYLRVGRNSFIGRVDFQLHAPVDIGADVCINDGVRIISSSHDVRDPYWTQFDRAIHVGDHAWIATGAVILPGVTIGRGAVVGACAVVTRSVPDFAVAAGNPARVRENVRCHDLAYSPVNFLAFRAAWLGKPSSK